MSEKSKKFRTVNDYYKNGLWTREMVENAVGRWITQEEALEILGGLTNIS